MRLIFPEDFAGQRKLLGNVNKKHTDDGVTSVLNLLLTEKGINLVADIYAGNQAAVHDESMNLLNLTAENFVKIRDVKFEPVFSHTRGEIQFLKSLKKSNVRQLGEWGVTVDNIGRINYPVDFAKRVKLVRDIKTKHETYPAGTSPLLPYMVEQDINLAADAAAVTDAEKAEEDSKKARRDAEKETQLRDKLWGPVLQHLHDIGDYCMKLFRGKEKKAGDYGFTIDDSKKAPKFRTSVIKSGSQKVLNAVIIGGTLTNIGTVEVHIYKGKTTIGNPIIVAPNGMLGIAKGFSTITVVNPSTLISAKVKVLCSK